ncbi:molybdopterin-dependent oxidoreductase [Actinosynnema pretiosum]|uniref:Molybdopterin oxidoreductase domain-containing protein n=1 Tax=Actinosynnema pretiosum TaxID=42197 RepID=A0A290Z983_9PSEU|nr:molybdopterin-dependent oxidoreductase [Actinosynnema pretiosum]ATE55568.1 hypothetical protein CNX65_21630 [Actinosynnema pretiosum]
MPGGGFAHGFGSMGDYGVGVTGPPLPTFPQGSNPVPDFSPCARISDLLLNHADVVLPAASSLERDDLAVGAGDRRLRAVRRVLEPVEQAREEFWIHARLAERLGAGEAFTEGLDSRG